jgi:polar amino acid transport system substrate-binding protein
MTPTLVCSSLPRSLLLDVSRNRLRTCVDGRAARRINLSNFLLVTGRSATGDPQGVAPDLAGEIASRLGVPIKYVPFKSPGELADAAGTGVWDIGLIGAEPQRAEKIVFTAAYCEIEAIYLVPAGSKLRTIADSPQMLSRVLLLIRKRRPDCFVQFR